MNAYSFRRDKTAVLRAIKAQLPFSEGKYQLLNSWNKIPFPTIFYYLNFSYGIRKDQVTLARTNIPAKGHKTMRESRKLHSKPFSNFFSLGAPERFLTGQPRCWRVVFSSPSVYPLITTIKSTDEIRRFFFFFFNKMAAIPSTVFTLAGLNCPSETTCSSKKGHSSLLCSFSG